MLARDCEVRLAAAAQQPVGRIVSERSEEYMVPNGNQMHERPVAQGGLRRVLWGFGLGAVLGLIGGLLSPRPGGPRRS